METPQFNDRRSERVYRRLHLLGPGPAAFFADAYRLMEEDIHLATRSHLVGHLLRELEGSVRGSLRAAARASADRKDCGANNSQAKEIAFIISQLDFEADGVVEAGWIGLVQNLERVAHRRGLHRPRPVDEDLHDRWVMAVDVLDRVLDRFEGRYADVFQRLEELLSIKQPTRVQLSELVNTIPHTPQVLDHFFSRLDHPEWFTGLKSRGMFDDAPPVEEDPETGRIRLPLWPAASYLKLMAKPYPEEVSEILRALRTDNPRALDSAVEIVLELPEDQAVALVPTVEEWVPKMARFEFIREGVVDLIERFSQGGEGVAASRLLNAILAPQFTEEVTERHLHVVAPREPVPYSLRHSAGAIFEGLAEGLGAKLVDLIADLLDPRLRRGMAGPFADEADLEDGGGLGLQDHSISWFPNLRAAPPHEEGQVREFLVIQLRQVLRTLHARGTSVEEILDSTGRQRFLLYRRIELEFLSDTLPPEHPHVRRVLLDPRFFKESEVRSEYAILLQNTFPTLAPEDRDRALSMVRSGFEPSWLDDPKEKKIWSEHWERDWLQLVRDHLDSEDRERLEQLLARHGEPRDLRTRDRPIPMSGGWGSPLSEGEIQSKSIDELKAFIKSWDPAETPGGSSLEGLAREFSGAVRVYPLRFSADAQDLVGFPVPFVEALLAGLREALREESPIEWGPVLSLGRWVVNQPVRIHDWTRQELTDAEGDFEQARKHLMWLLHDGLRRSGEFAVPFDERQRVWPLIEAVAEDPNPSPEFESEWLEKGMGPHGVGLNTPRPAAISVALEYLFWVNRNLSSDEQPVGMDVVPEVGNLLAEHLDPSRDRSVGVRAVIGQDLRRLIWFDPIWIEESRESLFPEASEHSGLRSALFDAYLRYGS